MAMIPTIHRYLNRRVGLDGPFESDETAPTLQSVTIGTNGTSWSFVFNEAVTVGAGGSSGWSVTMTLAGAITLTYASGDGTDTLVYTGSITVTDSDTVASGLNYTQPGNGIEDLAGNDLENISSASVTNNSTQFDPLGIAGCVLWLRSDLGVTKDGSNLVSAWADQSTGNSTVTQATADQKPVWTASQLNGHAGLVFDGIDDNLFCLSGGIITAVAGSDLPFSIFCAAKFSTTPNDVNTFCWNRTDNTAPLIECLMGRDGPNNYCFIKRDNAGNIVIAYAGGPIGTTAHYISTVHTGTATSIWQDGVLQLDNAAFDVGTLSNMEYFMLGARNMFGGIACAFPGTFFEAIAYDTALSTTNRQLVEGYLATRYRL